MSFRFTISLLITCLLISSCEAPRDNLLDPANPENKYQYINGNVKSISVPFNPIKDVIITWQQQTLTTHTNAAGQFLIETINAKDGWLHFSKEGYISDSVFVAWDQENERQFELFLNAYPVIDNSQAYSIILNRYPSLQIEQVEIRVELTDPDNDIDSVIVTNNYLDKKFYLSFNIMNKWHERIFSTFDLGIVHIDEVIGYPFKIQVKDLYDHAFEVGEISIERVIHDEVIFTSPSGNDTTGVSPTLSWQQFSPGYKFTYMLEIYTSEISPQKVWQKDNLPDTMTSHVVDVSLNAAEYFWVIWAIDEFGNRSRSKPASFIVN